MHELNLTPLFVKGSSLLRALLISFQSARTLHAGGFCFLFGVALCLIGLCTSLLATYGRAGGCVFEWVGRRGKVVGFCWGCRERAPPLQVSPAFGSRLRSRLETTTAPGAILERPLELKRAFLNNIS